MNSAVEGEIACGGVDGGSDGGSSQRKKGWLINPPKAMSPATLHFSLSVW